MCVEIPPAGLALEPEEVLVGRLGLVPHAGPRLAGAPLHGPVPQVLGGTHLLHEAVLLHRHGLAVGSHFIVTVRKRFFNI